jgi:4-hydroxybenzoate polyprenyltransferase
MRLDRPIGTLLLLWPTLISLIYAGNGFIRIDLLIIFCLGTLIMRSAGCVINDYFDRDFDNKVLRTSTRPIASGAVSRKEALILFCFLIFLACLLLTFLNLLALKVALAFFCILLFYPLAKRFFKVPQLVLGLAFSGGILMAFAATMNNLSTPAFLLFVGNYFWVLAYDTSYAMTDKKDDLSIGIGSSAIYFEGREESVIWLGCFINLLIIFMVGLSKEINLFFYLGMFLTSVYLIHLISTTDFNHEDSCLKFFKKNNWVGALIFSTVLIGLN